MINEHQSLTGDINLNISLTGNLDTGILELKPNLENLEVTPSAEEQVFKHENSYGYDEVRILGDNDLQPSNIKKGVEIFGVTGDMEEMPIEVQEGINKQEEIIENQETTLDSINQVIQEKILVKEKYKPRYTYQPISFRGYSGTELNHEVSMLDTTNFTNMSYVFAGCTNLVELNLSSWNTSNVTNFQSMFASCKALTELDLSNFDTSSLTNTSSAFESMYNLTRLDLSSWNTNKVTNMSYMFNGCEKLAFLDIRNFDFTNVTSYQRIFSSVNYYCEIIVKDETAKQWVLTQNGFPNVKTVAELEG